MCQLADICTNMSSQHRGDVGDVARPLGGVLAAPPRDPAQIRRYVVGDIK